uniref:Tetratricopeptide repeat protein n=1 Tax=Desertifilum tharense IPPAS B-1220 TaxID=1781255 RepID=A0ACD5GTF4_9CYAN
MAKKKRKTSPFLSLKQASGTPTWNAAMAQLEAGQLQQAQNSFLAIVQQQPNSAEGYRMLGVIAHRLGNLAVAIAHYQQAVTHKPDFPEVYNNLEYAFWQMGQASEADRRLSTSDCSKIRLC